MNSFYFSDSKIAELTRKGVSLVPLSDLERLKRISKKHDFEVGGRTNNFNQIWVKALAELKQLKQSDRFFQGLLRPEQAYLERLQTRDIIFAFLDYKGWNDDFKFLQKDSWRDLESYCRDLQQLGVDLPHGFRRFCEAGGYAGVLEQYSIKHCDPKKIEYSRSLQKQIQQFFRGCKTDEQRFLLINAVQLLGHDPDMDPSDFHRFLYPKGGDHE